MMIVIRSCPITHLGPIGPTFRYRRGHISRMRRDRYLRLVYSQRSSSFKRGLISILALGVLQSGTVVRKWFNLLRFRIVTE